ncbi:HAD-superfamily hydrolase, subfamily IIA containing protein [Tritrichomonas foetus]|uniref:HAD-superfamily hydrolase, subfamily IIA containing protein n=1 Tax=Tritrichomonas foetus TaxID=1144522 RepID=A0A1J4KFY8_9EUKA|nr:HAD-superfamily hydrolase, subfamily IIA containing protein [Tritrichomonas foetus]|eukprot:OHT10131.1 HAD-superfamily hydrolase, subfamily IIA containing protein [Tritrichomonas foetus]
MCIQKSDNAAQTFSNVYNNLTRIMSKNLILLDFEGTLHDGENFLPSSKGFIEKLSREDYTVAVISNSPQFSSGQLKELFVKEFGPSLAEKIIQIDAAHLAVDAFSKNGVKTVFAMCNDSICNELKEAGLTIYRPSDHAELNDQIAENVTLKENIESILIGVDKEFNFCSIALSSRYVTEKKTKFFVLGGDKQFRCGDHFIPGALTLSTPVRHGTFTDPIIIGKPSKELNVLVKQSIPSFEKFERIFIVGDNIETDFEIVKDLDNQKNVSILVMTGVTNEKDLEKCETKPTFVCRDLEEVYNKIVE